MNSNFFKTLTNRLQKPLSGATSHQKYAPEHTLKIKQSKDPLNAAVLILIYYENNTLFTFLIKRSEYNGHHSGQISFPGGMCEKEDNSHIETALREAYEETGIIPSSVEVLGTLTPLFIPVSNTVVVPVIGYTEKTPQFIIDPKEVQYIIRANINTFLDPNVKVRKSIKVRGMEINAPGFILDEEFVWGATAMIISEFTDVCLSV